MKKIKIILCLLVSILIFSCGITNGQTVFDLEILNVESQEWTRVAEIKQRELYSETFSSTEEDLTRVNFQLSNLSENALIITEILCEKEFVVAEIDSTSNLLPTEKVSFSVSAASFEIIQNNWIKVKYVDLSQQRKSDYFVIELEDFYNYGSGNEVTKITESIEIKVDELISLKDAFGFSGPFHYNVNIYKDDHSVLRIENLNYNSKFDYAYKDCYIFARKVGEQTIKISNHPDDIIVTVSVTEADKTLWLDNEWLVKYRPGYGETISSIDFEKYNEYVFESGSFDVQANSLKKVELFKHYNCSLYLKKEDNTTLKRFTFPVGNRVHFIPSESVTANMTTTNCQNWIYLKYRNLPQLTAVNVVEETISAISGSMIPFNVNFTPDDDYSFSLEIANPEIAGISSSGMIFPGVPGTTQVTVRSAVNHNLFDIFNLNVVAAELKTSTLSKGYFYGSSSGSNLVNYTFTASTAGIYQFVLEDSSSFVNACSASAQMSIIDGQGNLVYKDLPASIDDSYLVTMSQGEIASIIVSSKYTFPGTVSFFNLSVIEKK